MANVNVKPAELIGKKIVIKNTNNYYVVTAVEGDVVKTEFHMGDVVKPVPLNARTLENFFASGVWAIEGEETAKATATDDVEEVSDVQPTKPEPKVEEPKAEEKPKAEPKPKTQKPKAETPKAASKREESGAGTSSTEREQTSHASGKAEEPKGERYTIVDYTTSKGKAGKKIYGLSDTEPAYTMAATIHASASFERGKGGEKKHYLIFGPKYSAQAVAICAALNAGKPIANLQAIANGPAEGKTYTKAEVVDLMRRAIAGDKEALEFMNAA